MADVASHDHGIVGAPDAKLLRAQSGPWLPKVARCRADVHVELGVRLFVPDRWRNPAFAQAEEPRCGCGGATAPNSPTAP